MTRRYATRDALITYLRVAGEPRWMKRIEQYMEAMHRVKPGATRTALWRLTRAGVVKRTGPAWYELSGPADALDTNPPGLGHNLPR